MMFGNDYVSLQQHDSSRLQLRQLNETFNMGGYGWDTTTSDIVKNLYAFRVRLVPTEILNQCKRGTVQDGGDYIYVSRELAIVVPIALVAKTASMTVAVHCGFQAKKLLKKLVLSWGQNSGVSEIICQYWGPIISYTPGDYYGHNAFKHIHSQPMCARQFSKSIMTRLNELRPPLHQPAYNPNLASSRLHPPSYYDRRAPCVSCESRYCQALWKFLAWLAMYDWITNIWGSNPCPGQRFGSSVITGLRRYGLVHRVSESLLCATHIDLSAVPASVRAKYAQFPTIDPRKLAKKYLSYIDSNTSRVCEYEIRYRSEQRFNEWWGQEVPTKKPVTYAIMRGFVARSNLKLGRVQPGYNPDLDFATRPGLARYVEILLRAPSSNNIAVRRKVCEGGFYSAPTVSKMRGGRREKISIDSQGIVTFPSFERLFRRQNAV